VRGEHDALGVLEERILLAEPLLHVHVERPDVVRIVPVDVGHDIQERLELAPERCFANLDVHAASAALTPP
jgi:hypothetical protein